MAVVQRGSVFGGFAIKIGNKISMAVLSMAVVQRWPFTQVCCMLKTWISYLEKEVSTLRKSFS